MQAPIVLMDQVPIAVEWSGVGKGGEVHGEGTQREGGESVNWWFTPILNRIKRLVNSSCMLYLYKVSGDKELNPECKSYLRPSTKAKLYHSSRLLR